MLNDDEIVTSMQESDPVDDETDEGEDNNESSKGASNADAFPALETALEWSYSTTVAQENQGPCNEKMKVYNVSGFMYCMDRIQLSVIRTIAYPNGARSQLIRINDVLLYTEVYVIAACELVPENSLENFSKKKLQVV
ncbi:hypothetical protein TNCV_2740601 [Trichonephila clavipes]|nr:hypothetical protein TNCV_2740601 [Trichonephila clavipes]